MKKSTKKTIREQLSPKPVLSDDLNKRLDEMGSQFIRMLDSFTMDDVVTIGRKISQALTRETLVAWGHWFVAENEKAGRLKVVHGVYDTPVYETIG